MCDLIDLKSPDGKSIAGTKLASPLIPIPSETSKDGKNDLASSSSTSSGLIFEKRNSLDNNPFDNVHHKTVEYVIKQEDPFEIALEKALKYEESKSKSSGSKTRVVEFKDDFTPKRRRYSDILKMNKTLDDSLTEVTMNTICEGKKTECAYDALEKEIQDSENPNLAKEAKFCLKNGKIIPRLRVDHISLDSSILNQSAMNDSLTESSGSIEENICRSISGLRIQERMRCAPEEPDFLIPTEEIPKLNKHRRSLSQGDKLSPRKCRQQRSRSIVDGLTVDRNNEDGSYILSVPSIVFDDTMNKAFLQTQAGNNASMLSNLSNVSSITRLTSVSSAISSSNSSAALSNRTANCGFIESFSSDGVAASNSAIFDGRNVRKMGLESEGSATAILKRSGEETQDRRDLSDLLSKYTKLRSKSSESSTHEVLPLLQIPSVIGGSGIPDDKSICSKTEDKLIDVDVFVPEAKESPDSFPRKSVSSTSSDSVFLDSDGAEKSIFLEANTLAKTFEELASKTGSTSISSDDLVNSRPRWNFDMLPPSDDEALVEDLIELKKSPVKSDSPRVNPNNAEGSEKSGSISGALSEKSMLKDLETKFRDPENKIIASNLLLDLEKLVKSENNSEAAELLKSLEKALGVKCESNVDLLSTCFSVRNDLTKSPKRTENVGGNENIKDDNIEKSREDNSDIETCETFKQLTLSDDKNLQNNLNVETAFNKNDKSIMLVSDKYVDLEMKQVETDVSDNSSGKSHDDSIDAIKQQNQITDDQKMAVELLVGLGKLLTGENRDPVTSNLLKNLGIALNLASSNNFEDETSNISSRQKETTRIGTPVKNRVATPPRKPAALSAFSRTANRRSLELHSKSKSTVERVMRRSISVSQTPTSTTPNVSRLPSTPLSADKNKSYLKEGRKRFSSDPSPDIQSANARKSSKDITLKPVAVSELARQDKPSSTVVSSVKNRFKKKSEPDVPSKKGPMKAILPLGIMQRPGSSVKKESPLNGSVTPPKPGRETQSVFTVTTSTPFPVVHLPVPPKKSSKSKPMASSTPDEVGKKYVRRSTSQIPQSPGKNTFSCNISPVTSKTNKNEEANPSLNNSLSKIGTPSKSRQGSQLPKLSPMLGTKSPSKSNRGQRRSEPLQSYLPRGFATPKSPRERCGSDGSTSPLHNSNKLGSTVKPLNLISKLGRRRASVTEKENCA